MRGNSNPEGTQMNKQQVEKCMEIVQNREIKLSEVDMSVLDGLYLPNFKPVSTTLEVVAASIRWHCIYLNGQIASTELDEFLYFARKRIMIV